MSVVTPGNSVTWSEVVDGLSDAIAVIDRTGQLKHANNRYKQRFPEERLVVIESGEREVPPDAHPFVRAFREKSSCEEFMIRTWSREVRPYLVQSSQIGRGTLAVIQFHDVADQQHLQDRFLRFVSQKMHEPLNVLRSDLERLSAARSDESELLHRVFGRLAMLEALVEQLRTLGTLPGSRNELALRGADFSSVVSRSVQMIRNSRHEKEVELALEAGPLHVECDAKRLGEVASALIGYAIEHATGAAVRVTVTEESGNAVLRVVSPGEQIPAAELARIFSRFTQVLCADARNDASLGVQLYISNEIIRAHGGSIQAESTAGEGTIFTVKLPVVNRGTTPAV